MSASAFSSFRLLPAEAASLLGPTIVLAPHPDDESLGCGGLIALLRKAGLPVWCVLVSDGTMSHPGSRKYSAQARKELREQELTTALSILGTAPDTLISLGLPDGAVPTPDMPAGLAATSQLLTIIQQCKPATVLAPWRRDPHPDHKATSQLLRNALALLPQPPRLLEYVVWAWERASAEDLPQPGEALGWQLNVSSVLDLKQRAIGAHRSQLPGSPIDDDPNGFTLAPAMLAHFSQPSEVLLEVDSDTSSSLFAFYETQP